MNDEKTVRFSKTAGRICIAMACVFAVTFITGTFLDIKIAPVIFSDSNLAALWLSTIGIYIFCAAYAFYFGALLSQVIKIPEKKSSKILFALLVIVLGIIVLLICGGSVLDINNLGGIFPAVRKDVPQMIIMLFAGLLPISVIGFMSCRKRKDSNLLKNLILVLSAMSVTFLTYESIKTGLPRPRYRLIARGYEEIGFHKWFDPIKNKSELIAKYGIIKDDFKSFPSGHTANSVTNAFLFPSLALVYPKLKDRYMLLFVMGIIVALATLLSRMILGAHFLSDVSAGGFIAAFFSALYYRLRRKIN